MNVHSNLSIAIVCGGPSPEAEVSRSTGQSIAQALRKNYMEVALVELDSSLDTVLRRVKPDVVFPAVHGQLGEDGLLQGFLTILGIPFVGSGAEASMLGMNKILSKQVFQWHQLPVAKSLVVSKEEKKAQASARIKAAFDKEVVIKPACAGSGIGVIFAQAKDARGVKEGLEQALEYGSQALVEERIIGAEITAAVLERERLETLPVIEIRTPPGSWYDYEHRYTPGLSEHIIPAPLPAHQYARVQEVAALAHRALGCRDLSRADFVVPEKGEPILLEVNTVPGMTPTSLFPDAAQKAGISFPALVSLLVERAYDRSLA